MKLTRLTAAQQDRMREWCEQWVRIGLSCEPADWDNAEAGVRGCYQAAGLPQPKVILRMSSPFGAVIGGAMVSQVWDQVRAQIGNQVEAPVGAQVWDQVRVKVWDQVRAQIGNQVEAPVEAQVWDQVENQVMAQVGAQVRDQDRAQIGNQVEAPVEAQVWAQVGSQVEAQVRDQVENQVWDQVWHQVGKPVWDQVGAQVRDQVENQVENQVRDQVEVQVWDQVRAQVRDQVRAQVRDQVGKPVWDQVGAPVRAKVWDQVRDQVEIQVWDQVRAQVRDQVENQVMAQVGAQVWDQVRAQIGNQVEAPVEAQVWDQVGNRLYYHRGGQLWAAWYAYVTFFRDVCDWTAPCLTAFAHDERHGKSASVAWYHDRVCAISDRPERLVRNHAGLHCESGPALRYRDGWGIWALNGVRMPRAYVETPAEHLDARIIAREPNADIRRELVRKIGIERLCVTLNAHVLDRLGETYELLALQIGDNRIRPYLKMRNPSLGVWHVEGVAPHIRTVEEALQWRNQSPQTPTMLT